MTRAPLDGRIGKRLAVPDGSFARELYVGGTYALAVTANGNGAGSLAAMQRRLRPGGPGRALLSATCLPPGTDWWFTGADGRVVIS